MVEEANDINRRKFVRRRVPTAAASAPGFPAIVRAQGATDPHGLLTIRRCARLRRHHMERGLTMFPRRRIHARGRKVDITVADSVVFQRRPNRMQDCRARIACRPCRPLAAFEALAMDDYIRTAPDPDPAGRRCRRHDAAQGQSWFVRAT